MPRIGLYVTHELMDEIDKVRDDVNLSELFRQAFDLWRHGGINQAATRREMERLKKRLDQIRSLAE